MFVVQYTKTGRWAAMMIGGSKGRRETAKCCYIPQFFALAKKSMPAPPSKKLLHSSSISNSLQTLSMPSDAYHNLPMSLHQLKPHFILTSQHNRQARTPPQALPAHPLFLPKQLFHTPFMPPSLLRPQPQFKPSSNPSILFQLIPTPFLPQELTIHHTRYSQLQRSLDTAVRAKKTVNCYRNIR